MHACATSGNELTHTMLAMDANRSLPDRVTVYQSLSPDVSCDRVNVPRTGEQEESVFPGARHLKHLSSTFSDPITPSQPSLCERGTQALSAH